MRSYVWATLLAVLTVQAAERKDISVEDMVRYATIGDPESTDGQTWEGFFKRVTWSPDGQRAAVLVRRGNPSEETNEGTLLVYDRTDLLDDPRSETVAQFSSTSNGEPIALVRWLKDNRTLVFAGTRGAQESRVYRVDVDTRELVELTQESGDFQDYVVNPAGNRLAVITTAPWLDMHIVKDPVCIQRGCRVTADSLFAADKGINGWTGGVVAYDLVSGKRKPLTGVETTDPEIRACRNKFAAESSPNGRFALRSCTLKPNHWPKWWLDYTADPQFRMAVEQGPESIGSLGGQLVLLDLERGTSRRLSTAPWRWTQPEPIWIDDGKRLALVDVLEPLSGTDKRTRLLRASTRAIVLFDPVSGVSERIGTFDPLGAKVCGVHWNEKTLTLTVELRTREGGRPSSLIYRRTPKEWVTARNGVPTPACDGATHNAGVELVLKQSLNIPPVLVAIDKRSGREKRLLDPNPWLGERELGRVEAIEWLSKGSTWHAGLYYPPDYESGKRYPLMIQTHGFDPWRFSLDGYARNFPGRALVGQGVFMLQVDENYSNTFATPAEMPAVAAGYEAAIDHLDRLGLIDRNRVGIQGWSRTGAHTAYLLTHSDYPIAAAAFTSTGGWGYWWYLAGGSDQGGEQMERDYGAAPFGDGLAIWGKLSPGFNLDRVRTPTFMWANGGGIAGQWDWYAGLRRFNVPVEYWVLAEGAHEIFKAGERKLMTQLLVDWFRFWLKDEEDRDPAKAEQYARWRVFREEQNAALRQSRRPLGHR